MTYGTRRLAAAQQAQRVDHVEGLRAAAHLHHRQRTALAWPAGALFERDPVDLVLHHGMTMAFKVQDVAMLDQVKAGDKIRLRVERVNGTFTVTKLEAAN